MRLFNRIKQWAEASDTDKVQLDRRAFLKGMTVTAGGILIPGAAVFDMGRQRPKFETLEARWVEPVIQPPPPVDLRVFMNGIEMASGSDYVAVLDCGSRFRIQPKLPMGAGDHVSLHYVAKAQKKEGESSILIGGGDYGDKIAKRQFWLEYDLT